MQDLPWPPGVLLIVPVPRHGIQEERVQRSITVDPKYGNKEKEQNMHMHVCVEYLAIFEGGRYAGKRENNQEHQVLENLLFHL